IGIHTCLSLHKSIVTETLIKNLGKNQIFIETVDKNYLSSFRKEKLLKLNVSNMKEDKIRVGIHRVIEEMKQVNRVDFHFKKD
ncbi:GntR family transcriptional regulator, partial [Bacillus pseudomycoides]